MKKFISLALLFVLFTLASCKSFLPETPPINQTKTDIIQEPVFVELPEKSEVIAPSGTLVEIPNETIATNKLKEEILLPKNTQVVLKQDTAVIIPEKKPVLLPQGTKVETEKTNWYAVLLYAGLIISGIWIMISKKELN